MLDYKMCLKALGQQRYEILLKAGDGSEKSIESVSTADLYSRFNFYQEANNRIDQKACKIAVRADSHAEHGLLYFDDISESGLEFLNSDGMPPCCVVETSPGNFDCWLKLGFVMDDCKRMKLERYIISQMYIHSISGVKAWGLPTDPTAANGLSFGALAGFKNIKPQYGGFYISVREGSGVAVEPAAQCKLLRILSDYGDKFIIGIRDGCKYIVDNSVIDAWSKVIIFGAGSSGLHVHNYLSARGVKTLFWVDNSREKQGTWFNGLEVCEPGQIACYPAIPVVVASLGVRQIVEQLSRYGKMDVYDFNLAI